MVFALLNISGRGVGDSKRGPVTRRLVMLAELQTTGDGVFLDQVGLLPVEIAIDPTAPIRARSPHQISEHQTTGVIGGGITAADIDNVVIPQATAQMDRIVRAECARPAGIPPCGCVSGARADTLLIRVPDRRIASLRKM